MEMLNVEGSSNIQRYGYDEATCTLRVEFSSGGKYEYSAVPQSVWYDFRQAESKGRYFAANIKGRYDSHKV